MRFALDFGAGVLHGDGEASGAHGREVDDVIADKGGFFRLESLLLHDFFEAGALVFECLDERVRASDRGRGGQPFPRGA